MITVSIVSMVGTVRRDRPDGSPDVPQRRTNSADGADAKAAVSVITQMTEKHIRSMETRFRHSRCPALSEADPLPTCSCEPRAFGGGPKSRPVGRRCSIVPARFNCPPEYRDCHSKSANHALHSFCDRLQKVQRDFATAKILKLRENFFSSFTEAS